jgi:hypothetical protein
MKKLRRAYELDREKWFIKHNPNNGMWGYPLLGQNPSTLHLNMFLLTLKNMTTEE